MRPSAAARKGSTCHAANPQKCLPSNRLYISRSLLKGPCRLARRCVGPLHTAPHPIRSATHLRCHAREPDTNSQSPSAPGDSDTQPSPSNRSPFSLLGLLQLTSHGYHTVLQAAAVICLAITILLPSWLPLSAVAMPAVTPATTTLQAPARPASDPSADMASTSEDLLKEAAKQLESRVESALDVLIPVVAAPAATSKEEQEFTVMAHEVIREVWQVVDENYLDARRRGFDHDQWRQLRDQALSRSYRDRAALERAVRSMLARGLSDPYTRYVAPKDFEAMAKYDVTGIGLNLGTSAEFLRKTGLGLPQGTEEAEGGVWVVGVIIGSPADKAGIQQGDRIVAVDGREVGAESPFQVASSIQGGAEASTATVGGAPVAPPPSSVKLQVLKYAGSTTTANVPRAVRTIPTPVTDVHVEKRRKRGSVGYIRLATFNARAQRDLSAAIRQLEAQGVDELVLDLRDNYGGLVSEGIEVARLFLDDNATIVFTKGQKDRGEAPTAPGPPLTTKPLTVLVNEHSASASEILAGALKDNCRALLVGKKTYGKGLIQSVYALSDGSGLVATVGRYLTPNLTDIDQYGIRPDFDSMPSPEKRADALNACRLGRTA